MLGIVKDPVEITVGQMLGLIRRAAQKPEVLRVARMLGGPRYMLPRLWALAGRIPYRFDPKGVEFVRDPVLFLRQLGKLAGDCDDQAVVLAALCRAADPEGVTELVTVGIRPGKPEHHVYLRHRGVPIDPIVAGPPGPDAPSQRWLGWEIGQEKPVAIKRSWTI